MQWDSYRPVEFGSKRYGMKSESFRQYLDLPTRVKATLELAIGSEHAPRDELESHGWHLRDPLEVTKTPWSYQDYIRQSRGEFSVAKHGYVLSGSGWFSERSVGYLASGRPVITQDTGFSLPREADSPVFFNDGDPLWRLFRLWRNTSTQRFKRDFLASIHQVNPAAILSTYTTSHYSPSRRGGAWADACPQNVK